MELTAEARARIAYITVKPLEKDILGKFMPFDKRYGPEQAPRMMEEHRVTVGEMWDTITNLERQLRDEREASAELAKIYHSRVLLGYDRDWVEAQIKHIKSPIARAAIEAARKEPPVPTEPSPSAESLEVARAIVEDAHKRHDLGRVIPCDVLIDSLGHEIALALDHAVAAERARWAATRDKEIRAAEAKGFRRGVDGVHANKMPDAMALAEAVDALVELDKATLKERANTMRSIMICCHSRGYTAAKERKRCPCQFGNPCTHGCPCASPYSSKMCRRCCSYGSPEQQQAVADHIIANEAALAATRGEGKEA